MKGSSIVSYLLITAVSFVLLVAISLIILQYYKSTTKYFIESSFRQLAVYTSTEIIRLYNDNTRSEVAPEKNNLIVLSNISLDYPSKVGGRNYEISLISNLGIWNFMNSSLNVTLSNEDYSSNKIYFKTVGEPYVEYYYNIPNIPVGVQGSFKSGDDPRLVYVRYNYNGTVQDAVMFGEDQILIGFYVIN
jgi:hypothetical protein